MWYVGAGWHQVLQVAICKTLVAKIRGPGDSNRSPSVLQVSGSPNFRVSGWCTSLPDTKWSSGDVVAANTWQIIV